MDGITYGMVQYNLIFTYFSLTAISVDLLEAKYYEFPVLLVLLAAISTPTLSLLIATLLNTSSLTRPSVSTPCRLRPVDGGDTKRPRQERSI